jgi:hypothetical protein
VASGLVERGDSINQPFFIRRNCRPQLLDSLL